MTLPGCLFELYGIHKEMAGKDAQDFELFADWGQVLLKDFDEIDQYLADPEKVFTFLDEARALAVWNLGERPLTEQEQNYIRFYQSFKLYYFRLKERLLRKGRVYQGLAYRIAAENIEEISTGLPVQENILCRTECPGHCRGKDHRPSSGKRPGRDLLGC